MHIVPFLNRLPAANVEICKDLFLPGFNEYSKAKIKWVGSS